MAFQAKDKVVFIGDSITESGRWEEKDRLGYGYVRLLHDYYTARHPGLEWTAVNKGVGGDRILELEDRWEQDVIREQPSWVSVSIGINDVWRKLMTGNPRDYVEPELFYDIYEALLTQTQKETKAKLILMEPTIIEEDMDSYGNRVLRPFVEAVGRLAEQFGAILVPTHQAFMNYLKTAPLVGKRLTTDGVHMTPLGNMLMAQAWIQAFDGHAQPGSGQ